MDEKDKKDKKQDGIDIEGLKTAVADIEAADKAGDEKGVTDALTELKKLVTDALGDTGDPEDGDDNEEDNSAFDEKLAKYNQ